MPDPVTTAPSKAASVRPWPCPACHAEAGHACRSLTTGRVTDTHTSRLNPPAPNEGL